MNKIELSIEQLERIDFAVESGLGMHEWELVSLLSGGLTGIPVFKIIVQGKPYVIKLEDSHDENFDLVRNYKIMEAVSKQRISPKIYFTDAQRAIILMEYVEAKRPEASAENIKKFANKIRQLHDNNVFPKWKTVIEIMAHFYDKFPAEYQENNLIKSVMSELKKVEPILFDAKDIRACHGDLNPANILFDGSDYFLVDWQSAASQSFYFDLACAATWCYFYNEALCTSFLELYLDRVASEEREG